MTKYTVCQNGEILAEGSILSELLEHIIINHINQLEKNTCTITRLEKGYYKYINQLSSVFTLSDLYDQAAQVSWDTINNVLMIFNQDDYISESEFISIQKATDKGV